MSTNKNNIPYSASDIEKYRKGELSAGEMHDLEQAAKIIAGTARSMGVEVV